MASWRDLENIWTTFKELDVRAIQEQAEKPLTLAFVGEKGVGKSSLIAALRTHARSRERLVTTAIEADLKDSERASLADLIVLMLDARQSDLSAQSKLYGEWTSAGRNVLVFYNKMDTVVHASEGSASLWAIAASNLPWSTGRLAFGTALDPDILENDFVPRVLDSLPNRHLAVARCFPLFRFAVANSLIAETALTNATYSFSTGIAEIIPALDIPFNIADIVILTKNQAMMVYKLGLALGLPPRWQDQLAQLGGVIGAGFLWRQVARQLVGLIPGWGILPKIAIAYAGTYAVGEAVMYWYKTGHKISKQAMGQLYAESLARGKQIAQNLMRRAPRVTMPALPLGRSNQVCAKCMKVNAADARYCSNCGNALS